MSMIEGIIKGVYPCRINSINYRNMCSSTATPWIILNIKRNLYNNIMKTMFFVLIGKEVIHENLVLSQSNENILFTSKRNGMGIELYICISVCVCVLVEIYISLCGLGSQD